jgi:hypothetical protein
LRGARRAGHCKRHQGRKDDRQASVFVHARFLARHL